MDQKRRQEVLDVCLDYFVQNGYAETTTRNLSAALNLQNAGIYYYFKSKDDAVLQCIEAASARLEGAMFTDVLDQLHDPEHMAEILQQRAREMSPAMQFMVSVRTSKRYGQQAKEILQKRAGCYFRYPELIAQSFGCDLENARQFVSLLLSALSNYMIYEEEAFFLPQLQMLGKIAQYYINEKNRNKGGAQQ